jgi:uncharacterized protein (TIGR02284 family)
MANPSSEQNLPHRIFTRVPGELDMSNNDSIVELHTALIDACNGYDEAIKDAQKPDLVALFQRAKALHEKAHANIHAILSARGVTPDEKGSFMSNVHETVISVRSAVVGLDKGSLSAFASGEERLIDAYQAIQSNSDGGPARAALEQQRSALSELVGEMQRKAA